MQLVLEQSLNLGLRLLLFSFSLDCFYFNFAGNCATACVDAKRDVITIKADLTITRAAFVKLTSD